MDISQKVQDTYAAIHRPKKLNNKEGEGRILEFYSEGELKKDIGHGWMEAIVWKRGIDFGDHM